MLRRRSGCGRRHAPRCRAAAPRSPSNSRSSPSSRRRCPPRLRGRESSRGPPAGSSRWSSPRSGRRRWCRGRPSWSRCRPRRCSCWRYPPRPRRGCPRGRGSRPRSSRSHRTRRTRCRATGSRCRRGPRSRRRHWGRAHGPGPWGRTRWCPYNRKCAGQSAGRPARSRGRSSCP